MFRAFFIFAAPAIVLVTKARLGFSFGNISIVGTFEAKFKINFPGPERESTLGARLYRLQYTHPQGHLRFQDGGWAVYSDSIAIV